jgi:AcrR family transcriptional regulator
VDHERHAERREQRHAARRERHATRRERRHSETRDEILVAAREVLLERGAADLSLREIARRAEFSPGALYKYFDSKDDVIKALADNAMGALLADFAKVPADLPPEERALELGMTYLEFARRNPEDVGVIALHESTPHPLPLTDEHRTMEEVVVGVFRDGVAGGVFTLADGEDPDFMAYGAWALVQGLATFEQQQRPDVADRVRSKQRQLLRVYINGLKTDWSGKGRPSASPVEGP